MISYHLSVLFLHYLFILSLYVELSIRSRFNIRFYPDGNEYRIDFLLVLQRPD